jgi:hypothetical protein
VRIQIHKKCHDSQSKTCSEDYVDLFRELGNLRNEKFSLKNLKGYLRMLRAMKTNLKFFNLISMAFYTPKVTAAVFQWGCLENRNEYIMSGFKLHVEFNKKKRL